MSGGRDPTAGELSTTASTPRDRASLLPNAERPALVWTFALDAEGARTDFRLERALVRSRSQLEYVSAQASVDRGADEHLALLREIGELRRAQEAERGGASLNLPDEEVVLRDDGRYDIDGDNVYALVQSYGTVAPAEKKYESHRIYADIQYVAEGSELILYAPIAELHAATAYDGAKDFLLYGDPAATTPLLLGPGRFAIFLPQDGHKPGCIDRTACRMKKVVIKVRV